LSIVFPAEPDLPILEPDQAAVGDGHPMGVAAEIVEYLLRTAERSLGVDDPCDRRSPGKENGM
jgi:hypothetical protein